MNMNALVMKEINTHLVRKTLRKKHQATKQQIAEATVLSVVTVGKILQSLIDEGKVFDAGLSASMGGRPAQMYRFNEDHAHVLVLFTHEKAGQDMLYVRVANLYGECIYQAEEPLENITLRTFEPYIDAALRKYNTIRAIGFGLPGVELDGKILHMDYPALKNTSFAAHYQRHYQLPVLVENDVNAACVGFCKRQQIQSEAATLYLYFPQKYAPGSGIYIHDALYKGNSNFAGEIWLMPLGINWVDPSLYASKERICEAITTLTATISALLNPHSIVLHGPFLTEAHLQEIEHRCTASLPAHSMPNLLLAKDFTLDYQHGMIEQTLALLETPILNTL